MASVTLWLVPASGASVPFTDVRPSTETISQLCDYISSRENWLPGTTRVYSELFPNLTSTTPVSAVPTYPQHPLQYWQESSALSRVNHADALRRLALLGFPPQQAQQALVSAGYSFERAAELLAPGRILLTSEILDSCVARLAQTRESVANFRRFGGSLVKAQRPDGVHLAFVKADEIAEYLRASRGVALEQFIAQALARFPPAPAKSRAEATLEAMWERAIPRWSPRMRTQACEIAEVLPFRVACQVAALAEGTPGGIAAVLDLLR